VLFAETERESTSPGDRDGWHEPAIRIQCIGYKIQLRAIWSSKQAVSSESHARLVLATARCKMVIIISITGIDFTAKRKVHTKKTLTIENQFVIYTSIQYIS